VLVDEASRRRYDRVGHTAYVRDHLDSPAWSVEETGPTARSTGTGSNGPGTGDTGASADADSADGTRSSGRGGAGDDPNAENYQRYRSSHAEASESGSERTHRTGRTNRSGRTDRTGRKNQSGRTDTGEADAGGTSADGADTDEYGTWSTDAGQDWAFSGSSSASTATGGHSADPRDRARADGWQAAHASTNAYTPSGYEPSAAASSDVGVGSPRDVLRQVGPWLAFHFVFLISAFVTIWLIMTWLPSVPTLFVSLLLLGATVFFSILHMVSQVYS
jgi:hypothetical protein